MMLPYHWFLLAAGIVITAILFTTMAVMSIRRRRNDIDVLISSWKKEYLIPRNAHTRNFIVCFLLEFYPYSVNMKMDLYYQFWQKSQDCNFEKNCRTMLADEATKEKLIHELKDHLSQIIIYRCYYQHNQEGRNTIAKHNIAVQEMQYNQNNDKQFFKRIFRLESIDSLEFQKSIDEKLHTISNSTLQEIIDHL